MPPLLQKPKWTPQSPQHQTTAQPETSDISRALGSSGERCFPKYCWNNSPRTTHLLLPCSVSAAPRALTHTSITAHPHHLAWCHKAAVHMPIPKGTGTCSPMLQLCNYSTWLQGHADPTETAHKKGLCKGPSHDSSTQTGEVATAAMPEGRKEELKGTV